MRLKSYTDINQSRKLAKILPLESADMYWDYDVQKHEHYPMVMDDQFDDTCICAWSLAALLGVLPEGVIENYYAPNLQKENEKYSIAYGNEELLCIADNPVDACYEMIIRLHEQNLL